MALGGGVVAFLLVGAFALVFLALLRLRDAGTAERRSEGALIAATRLEKSVMELDEDSRGLVLTGDPSFLRDYTTDRAAVPGEEASLVRLSATGARAGQARQIVRAGETYLDEYVTPLIGAARADPATARSMLQSGQGPRSLDALREQCAAFESAEGRTTTAAEQRSVDAARTAAATAGISAVAALVLVCLYAGSLTRVTGRPVRGAAGVAGALADGDLDMRMPETSPGELGTISARFNRVVRSLKVSRDRLRQVAEEQGALRRVATLVAGGVPPTKVFDAVAAEVGRILAVHHTEIIRFESDDTARVVGYWNDPGVPEVMPPLNGHWPIEDGTVTATVRNTERPARMKNYERATSAIGIWAHAAGIRCVVGCPVKVEGRIWGAMLI